MIRVIVSHDVDHLYRSDHWFRDLVYPKLWIRSSLQLIKREISVREWILRIAGCFRKNRNNIEQLTNYDNEHGIVSTFFFGMSQGLGMSYKPEEAVPMIHYVRDKGFAVGVHGIEYKRIDGIREEFNRFIRITGINPKGIRMHYVRFDKDTFNKLNETGYAYDSTEFDKSNSMESCKNPYKVGNMWEFPLTIMDEYLPKGFESARDKTIEILNVCKEKGIEYISVLFHDNRFCDDYINMKKWYLWLTEYFEKSDEYEYISYDEAVERLERNKSEEY